MLIFGTSNLVNNINVEELSEELSIEVCLIKAYTWSQLKKKISKINPDTDKIVVIHNLGNDCRKISEQNDVANYGKRKKAKRLTNNFCDLAEGLVAKYGIKVFISNLLYRNDRCHMSKYSNPNNLRQYMNLILEERLQNSEVIKVKIRIFTMVLE